MDKMSRASVRQFASTRCDIDLTQNCAGTPKTWA
ncbi:hypothetical protein SAMN00790413_01644 [Deinococcus hopiensis KR-140]|uniref:Uncharacterized protein n=1 Tax=Deinococcus hopiensis KR-140 TaxID=695939 RepID=A0A1W1VGU9_9DEIO|nr:hypothetical protein SAMN00790413_01644 [Deinococcus hopiensis KR-140]